MALSSELRTIMYRGLPRTPKMRPWLMLPAASEGEGEGGEMEYRFYDLVEKRHVQVQVNVEKRGVVVGSSHGWLALFNKRNCDLFLSNPLTRRHIKLPPIHKLPIPVHNLRTGAACVDKVILSNSPDEKVCRTMIIYGPEKKLAFCRPGSCPSWSYLWGSKREGLRFYEDMAYSSVCGLFFCSRSPNQMEAVAVWGQGMVEMEETETETEEYKGHSCSIRKYVVVAEYAAADDVHLYDVTRYIDKIMNKTVGFGVRKYDWVLNTWRYMDGYLNGLSFFVGGNHSFVSQDLQPDSIYFIDHTHVGLFDYMTQKFSTCYHYDHHHPSRPAGSISWFTPTPH